MRLFDATAYRRPITPLRRISTPAGMLTDRGILVVDDVARTTADDDRGTYRLEQRAVAEFIGLGAWCDPLAWHETITRARAQRDGCDIPTKTFLVDVTLVDVDPEVI